MSGSERHLSHFNKIEFAQETTPFISKRKLQFGSIVNPEAIILNRPEFEGHTRLCHGISNIAELTKTLKTVQHVDTDFPTN
jgi:hypothetical protein